MLEKREMSMLFLVALGYLLLCVRLRVQIDVSIVNTQGSVVFAVGAFGVCVRHEAEIARKEHGIGLCLKPKRKRQKKEKTAAQRAAEYVLVPYFRELLRHRGIERLMFHVRLGLGDACDTAVAVGAVRACLCALAAPAAKPAVCNIRVTPEFAKACLVAQGRGIFFCQPGDIILTALKTARRKRREGLKWTSIPSRA